MGHFAYHFQVSKNRCVEHQLYNNAGFLKIIKSINLIILHNNYFILYLHSLNGRCSSVG